MLTGCWSASKFPLRTMLLQLAAGPAQQQLVTAVDLQQAGPELTVQLRGAGRRVQQLGPDVALQLMGVVLQLLEPDAAAHLFDSTPLPQLLEPVAVLQRLGVPATV